MRPGVEERKHEETNPQHLNKQILMKQILMKHWRPLALLMLLGGTIEAIAAIGYPIHCSYAIQSPTCGSPQSPTCPECFQVTCPTSQACVSTSNGGLLYCLQSNITSHCEQYQGACPPGAAGAACVDFVDQGSTGDETCTTVVGTITCPGNGNQ